jgi:FkbM family methyltransferase
MITRLKRQVIERSWRLKEMLGLPPRSEKETYARLSWCFTKKPRYTAGEFRFPFGVLQYVDSTSLKFQYLEIFVQRIYDFDARCENPVIIDCGANVGLSVIWFKQRYPNSRIIAFEADPVITEVLRANVATLGLKKVEIVDAAVWDSTGKAGFVSDGADGGRIAFQGAQKIINTVRLAEVITEPVDLLKLDIEGAEYVVLQDLCKAGKIEQVEHLICEIHGQRENKGRLIDLLKALREHRFSFTFNYARCAPDLPGEAEPTPFPVVCDGKFLLHLYAWRSEGL